MNTKECRGCNIVQPLENFHKNKGTSDGHHVRCKPCKLAYDKLRRTQKEVREKERLRGNQRSLYDWRKKIHSAKQVAKARGLEFSITVDDVVVPSHCPLLGIPLVLNSKTRWNKPSIDRIDSSKGYIKGNVWVISLLANTMKSHATKEQLRTFSKNVLNLFKENDDDNTSISDVVTNGANCT